VLLRVLDELSADRTLEVNGRVIGNLQEVQEHVLSLSLIRISPAVLYRIR